MRDILEVLTIGTLVVLGVFFGTGEFQNMITLAGQCGMPLNTLLAVTMLQVPTGAMYALPAGLLASTIFVFARMRHDSELLALDTLGIPRWRLMIPLLAVGIICSTFSFVISDVVAPRARHLSSQLFLLGIYKVTHPFPGRCLVELKDSQDRTQKVIMLGIPAGGSIDGFLMFDLTKAKTVSLLWSQCAQWQRGSWVLTDGRLFDLFSPASDGVKGSFGNMKLGVVSEIFDQIENKPRDDLDKTMSQLRQEINELRARNKPVPQDRLLQYHRRQSQPLGCLLLVIAAAPMVFMRARGNIKLPIFFGAALVPSYFLLQQICLSLAANGRLDPLIAAWLPASILCACGLFLTGSTKN